jgi:transposase
MHRLQEMVRLHRQGLGARRVARQLDMSPNTERKYRQVLEPAGLLKGDDELPSLSELRLLVEREIGAPKSPPQEVSTVEAFRDDIAQMLKRDAGPTAIYDRLRLEREDFDGSLSAVKRMCVQLKKERGPRPQDVVLRVQTAPGDVAQVDFGYVGKLFCPDTGRVRKAYAFVLVLGHSRLMYVDLVFDQTLDTWLDQHQRAFRYFDAVPQTLVPDNLKAAVMRCYFGFDEKPELNRSYRELARHYGFRVDPTPPYSPQHKGKVEAAVKYVKQNFFKPRALETMKEARAQLAEWLEEIANARVHGTTGKVPREHYAEVEREAMLDLPPGAYSQITWKQAKVHPDSHVAFERRLYSVPFKLIGQQLWVRAEGNSVVVYANDEKVARHARKGPRYHTSDAHLPEGRRDLRHRSRDWWQAKATRMSPTVGEYIEDVFGADDVYSQLRTVQAMVSYLEQYPVDRADAACRRARVFGNYSYKGLRKILVDGLDMEPSFPTALYVHGKLEEPRFARSMSEILGTQEVDHGEH